MLEYKVSDEALSSLIAQGGGHLYQNVRTLELTGQKRVVRFVITEAPCKMSDEIRASMELEKIMYVLVSPDWLLGQQYFPSRYFENAAYEGRPFIHGVFDCYSLCADWCSREGKTLLPWNISRPYLWWKRDKSLYMKNMKSAGWEMTTELTPGNIVMFELEKGVANHAAILLEDGQILHHLMHSFSCIEPIPDSFRSRIAGVAKYVGIPQ